MNKKINILIPMSGKGQRFLDEGYSIPKSLIMAGDKQSIDWSMDSVDYSNCNLIFVIRNEHSCNFDLDKILKNKYGNDITIIKTYEDTRGSVETCLFAKDLINNDNPLVVYCLDVCFKPKFQPYNVADSADGMILTFRSNSPNYSYTKVDESGNITKVAEKVVISNMANVGIYYFKQGKDFVNVSEEMIQNNLKTNGEFYVAPLYNLMFNKNKKCIVQEVDEMHVMGTPKELKFFVKNSLNKFGENIVALCCDHSGFELKEKTKKVLDNNGIQYIDYGCYTNNNCDQVDYTILACKSIEENICSHGIGFCRTGQAINITANKFKNIKAALIFNEYTAEYAIKHNAANFFSMASKFIDENEMDKIIKRMKDVNFQGGRHQVRVQKIEEL